MTVAQRLLHSLTVLKGGEMIDKDIYKMSLFEEISFESGDKLSRVPGGWVWKGYDQVQNYNSGQWDWQLKTMIFIPFDNEFQKKEEAHHDPD